MPPTWTCDTCGMTTTVPVEGVNVVEREGIYYCAHCVNAYYDKGELVVEFPSDGMMIPDTIMTEDERGNKGG